MSSDDFKFDYFARGTSARQKEPRATLQARGAISLNQAAFDLMGSPKAAELGYDKVNRVISIRPVAESVKAAYPIRVSSGGQTYAVSYEAFARHFCIEHSQSRRYPCRMYKDSLIIDLREAAETLPSRQKPA